MEQEEAINKIRKLLRLSESPNENEAQVALKKARELMLQYHISEGSLDEQEKTVVWKEVELTKKWMSAFYAIIARNNRCDCYQSTYYKLVDGKYKKMRKIHIVGFEFDIECVIVMADMVENTVKNGISEFRKNSRQMDSYKSTAGVTDSYVYGFRQGLQRAFDEQNAKQEYHLMCITPKEVKDEMDAVPNLRTHRETVHLGYSSNEMRALSRGRDDGYNTGLRKQIGDA